MRLVRLFSSCCNPPAPEPSSSRASAERREREPLSSPQDSLLLQPIGAPDRKEPVARGPHEATMTQLELQAAWKAVRNDPEQAARRTRLEYAHFARFNQTLAAATSEPSGPSKQDAPLKFEPASLPGRDEANRFAAVLQRWETYAADKHAVLKTMRDELIQQRLAMGEAAFHDSGHEPDKFKPFFKRLNSDVEHLRAAQTVSKTVARFARGGKLDAANFRVLMRGGQVAGGVKWGNRGDGKANYIEDIVADPRNIVPDSDQLSVVAGMGKAAIALSILENRRQNAGKGTAIDLYPATNKVKGLYDRFGFRVMEGDKEVERPQRGAGKPRRSKLMLEHEHKHKAGPPAWFSDPKYRWHDQNREMRLTPARAQQFIEESAPGKVLNVPEDLRPYAT